MSEADAGVPAQILEWADACRGFVKDALGIELDFTPETLPLLDHYVRSKAKPASEEVQQLLMPPLGAYFGEVVRRRLDSEGARWHAPGEDFEQYRLEFESFFLHFNPLGVVLEVLRDEDTPGYGAHFQMLDDARSHVESVLSTSPEITADDYYTFTMRYETLELIVSVLLGLEEKHHAGQPRRFGRDVYRAATGQLGKDSLS